MGPDRRSKKIGMAPGSLIYIGDKAPEAVTVSIIDYNGDRFQEQIDVDVETCRQFLNKDTVTWINISGLHQTAVIERIGNLIGLHSLLQEDVLNTEQRPKMDDFDDHLFVVLKMIDIISGTGELEHEQISLVIGPNYVISFQERPGDVFNPVRDRLRRGKGRIRKSGADYLAYALMDMIVDHYFKILEDLGEQIEILQDEVIDAPKPDILQAIHRLKHQMIYLRRSVWPVREIINNLLRIESRLIGRDVQRYFKDIHDHAIQVVETVETYRDVLSGVLDIYLSNVSNRMNEVMKVLTVIATIFIPLTFLAGVYGMNFKYMPELEWRYAYPILWIVNIVIAIAMLAWFRKKRWL